MSEQYRYQWIISLVSVKVWMFSLVLLSVWWYWWNTSCKVQRCKGAKLSSYQVAKVQRYTGAKFTAMKLRWLTSKQANKQTNKQTNGVTLSLLELLVSGKNYGRAKSMKLWHPAIASLTVYTNGGGGAELEKGVLHGSITTRKKLIRVFVKTPTHPLFNST